MRGQLSLALAEVTPSVDELRAVWRELNLSIPFERALQNRALAIGLKNCVLARHAGRGGKRARRRH